MTYTTWDVETTIRTSYKRKGNPFDPQNFVVMSGWKRKGGKVVGEYYGTATKPADWFTKLLESTTILVGQNIKFDVLYALLDNEHGVANRKAWMAWVAGGGLVWDIQLAEYLLGGMDPADHMLSLDELAPRYGGNVKFDEVKALWKAGVSTEDIPVDLLRAYLCGTTATDGSVLEHGDIGNTEVVFLGQLEAARAAGQVKSILMNMGSLLCTIEMEYNGMAVDIELGMTQAKDLAERIAELSIELNLHLPADLPFVFNWSSGNHKSAMIFGGTVKYELRTPTLDDEGKQLYVQKTDLAYYLNGGGHVPVCIGDANGEAWKFTNLQQFASGKNAGEYKTKQVKCDDLERPRSAMRDYYYTFPGVTEARKQWAGAKTDCNGVPVYSVSGDVIEALGNRGIPFLDSLSKVVGLTKDLSTYYIVVDPDDGTSKGMLTLVQADGIIHHMLNHTSTVTARFSSSNPNLQNLPKEGKSVVKSLFVSRFSGGRIIQSDFTALEVYVQAILTKCKQLIVDLQLGLDMHCARVASKENISYEEAVLRCKGDKARGIAPTEGWPKKRQGAKEFSFQRAYGAGAQKISDTTGIPVDDVQALIVAENERYPEVEKFYEKMTDRIKDGSHATNKWAEHPDIPGAKANFRKSYYRTPDNKLYSYRESLSPEFLAKKGVFSSFSPTEIKNYIVQGEGGEWAKAAMWLAIRAYYKHGNFGNLALLVNQVHDALYTDADPSVALEAAALLEAAMLAASEFMEWYFGWTVPVPVPSETMWGANMMEESKMPDGFSEKVAIYRQQLRDDYMGGYVPSFEANMKGHDNG